MPKPAHPPTPLAPVSLAAQIGSMVFGLLPAGVLVVAAVRYSAPSLGIAAVLAFAGGILLSRTPPVWRPPTSISAVGLFLAAYGVLWLETVRVHPQPGNPVTPIFRGILLVAAVGLLIAHDLARTGLGPRRKALAVARRLSTRSRWPDSIPGYLDLSDVRALRTATQDDPGPALDLLVDHRVEVRRAALAALIGRPYWRPAESALVMGMAKTADPMAKAMALTTLARATDPVTVAGLTGFLRDPCSEVRAAAGAAILTDPSRWPVVRDAVREALAAPALAGDGPLPGATDRLTPMAICDLTSWAAEQEPLAGRSVRTLAEFFALKLQTGRYPDLPAELGRMVTDAQTPTTLRVELAGLLRGLNLLPPELLDRMTDADQPGPVRLLAAELMLATDPNDGDAINVLRGLARQPNRETAITIARLLQAYLGLDFGLPNGPIAPQSRPAAEVAKRVLQWAMARTGHTLQRRPAGFSPLPSAGSVPDLDSFRPPPGPRWK